MFRLRLGLLVVTVAISGCGGHGGDGGQHTESAGTKREQQAVQQVAFQFWQSYARADSQATCGLMAPELRARFERALHEARPELRRKACAKLFLAAFRDPGDQPPAATEGHDAEFKRTSVDGAKATLAFTDGHAWKLEKAAGHWRITAFPILPPSLAGDAGGSGTLS